MKKLTLIIIGILLVSGVIASIGLSNANTIIPYERDEDTKLTEARMELKETGETKCNALTCWVKVHFTESGRGKTDIITIQGVNKEPSLLLFPPQLPFPLAILFYTYSYVPSS